MSQELKPYRVTIAHDACTTHDVQASNPDDAADKAMSDAGITLCHQCSKEIELGDPIRTVIVEDMTTGEHFDDIDPSHEVVVLRAKVAELEAALARTQQPEQVVPEDVRRDADRWRYAMDWGTKGFAVCKRVGNTGTCWEPIKTAGPIDAAIDAAMLAASGAKGE